MQHWELLCPGGLSFVCDDGLFQPSTDSFLLGSFPRLKPGLRVCDLGSGTGLLGLLLFQRQRALSVTGVELLPDAVRLAEQAAARNGLADRLIFRRGDLRKIRGLLPAGGFDLVVCNPPYYPAGSGRLPETEALRAARSETGCTLEDICTAAAWLLRWGGSFCLVHKPERLADLCCALRARGLEPKRLRLVCRRAGDAPSLLLLEARRGGRPGLDIAAPNGTPIAASAGGQVIWAGPKGTYGNLVKIDHGNGFTTYYAHCSELLVQEGDQVTQGQTIALVGSTGRSTGPHCHFELLWQDELLNPQLCLH